MVLPPEPDLTSRRGSDPIRSQRLAAGVSTAGGATTLFGTFLPWLHSGSRGLSSYELADLVGRLGFSPGGWADWSLRLWPLVPLCVVCAVVATWAATVQQRLRVAAVGATVISSAWVVGTAVAVVAAPDVALFRLGVGLWVAVVGCGVSLVAALAFSGRATRSSAAS